jgi:hypothetical protein
MDESISRESAHCNYISGPSEANHVGEKTDPTFWSTANPDQTEPLKYQPNQYRTKGDMKYYFNEPSPGQEPDSPKSGCKTPTPHCSINDQNSKWRQVLRKEFGNSQFAEDTITRLEEFKAREASALDLGTGLNFTALNKPTSDDERNAEVEAAECEAAETEAAAEDATKIVDQNDNVEAEPDKADSNKADSAQESVRVINNGIVLDDMFQDKNGGPARCQSPFRLLENGMTIDKLIQEDPK